jgi:hypothetical protein
MMFLFCIKKIHHPMQLMMYIGNDLIESVPVTHENLRRPGYLGAFKRTLKLKYQELIMQCEQPPEFLVVDPNPPNSIGTATRSQ